MRNHNLFALAASAATLGVCMATNADAALGSLDNGGAAGGGTPAPATDPNTFVFRIPNTETDIKIELQNIPAEVRLDLLRKSVRDYVTNSVNQVGVRTKKANENHDAYDAAMKADPLQTAVTKPEGERTTGDFIGTAAAARERLYKGEVRKQGEGGGSTRQAVDPLVKLVTEAVVRELHEKDKAAGGKRKYVEINAEVAKAGGGVKYLEAKIAERVQAGGDEATLRKFMDERYIKPAQMMLGTKTNKATDAANAIL